MSHSFKSALLIAGVAIVLAACGGGGGGTSSQPPASSSTSYTVEGTAATGRALQGTINLYGRNGGKVANVAIDTDGRFSVQPTGLTPPFLIEAVPDDPAQPSLYSFSIASGVANVTPMTTLALYLANGGSDPAALASSWPARAAAISTALPDAQKTVNANFVGVFSSRDPSLDIDFTRYNFFTEPFAIGDPYDRILDLLSVDVSGGSLAVTVGGTPFSFDGTKSSSSVSIAGVHGHVRVSGADAAATGGDFYPEDVNHTPSGSIEMISWQNIFQSPSRGVTVALYDGRLGYVNYSVAVTDSTGSITSYSYKIDCYNPVSGSANAAADCGRVSVDTTLRRVTFDRATLVNINTAVGEAFGSNGATAPLTLSGTLTW